MRKHCMLTSYLSIKLIFLHCHGGLALKKHSMHQIFSKQTPHKETVACPNFTDIFSGGSGNSQQKNSQKWDHSEMFNICCLKIGNHVSLDCARVNQLVAFYIWLKSCNWTFDTSKTSFTVCIKRFSSAAHTHTLSLLS